MIWDRICKAAVAQAAADPLLVEIFDQAIRWASPSAKLEVPCLDLQLVGHGPPTELWDPFVVQWDIWTHGTGDLTRAERRLWLLFQADLPLTIGGVTCWGWCVGGEPLAHPDRNDYFGKATRFQFTPLREQYVSAPA